MTLANLAQRVRPGARAARARPPAPARGFITQRRTTSARRPPQRQRRHRALDPAAARSSCASCKPTLEDLGALADEMTPVLDRPRPGGAGPEPLHHRSSARSRPTRRPSIVSLGKTTDVARPACSRRLSPVVKDLQAFAHTAKPGLADLDASPPASTTTGGIEQFMNYIFFQMHGDQRLRRDQPLPARALLVNVCSTYVTTAGARAAAPTSPQTASRLEHDAATAAASTTTARLARQHDARAGARRAREGPAEPGDAADAKPLAQAARTSGHQADPDAGRQGIVARRSTEPAAATRRSSTT